MTDQNKPEDAIPEEESPEESVEEPDANEEPAEESEVADEAEAAGGSAGATGSVSGVTSPASAAASTKSHEEPPYIDDPVSKWWIGIIVAVFALIFAVRHLLRSWRHALGHLRVG